MTRDGGDAAGPPRAHLWRADEITEGYWTPNSHWPFPVTPLYADFEIGRHFTEGYRRGDAEFRDPWSSPERDNWRVIDGWIHHGSLGPGAPPAAERIVAFEERLTSGHERTVIRRWREATRPAFVRTVERLRSADLTALDNAGLLRHIRALSEALTDWWAAHFVNLWAAAIIIGRWALFCRERLALDDAAIGRLLTGSAATSDPGRLLETIAARVAADPALRSAVDGPDPWSQPALRQALQPYLDAYGDRALEFEYARPTLRERPDRAVQVLRAAIARREAETATAAPGGPEVRRDAEIAGLRARLPDDATRAEFDGLLAAALTAYQLREDDVGFASLGHGLMRYALLETGRRLAALGLLDEPGTVFFLRRDELEDALAGRPSADLGTRAAERRTEHAARMAAPPPGPTGTPPADGRPLSLSPEARRTLDAAAWYFGRQGAPPADEAATPATLRGIGVSPGVYSGPARIVRTEADFDRVLPGDVLVCPTTNPAWTVLFPAIGALVTESGGILSHPAIAAREYGIPAVVNARDALASVADGRVIEVDGDAGTVRQ